MSQEFQELPESVDLRESEVQLEIVDHEETLDLQVQQVLKVKRENVDLKESEVWQVYQVQLEIVDREETLDLPVQQVLEGKRENVDLKESKVWQVYQGQLEIVDQEETLDFQVHVDFKVCLDPKAPKFYLVQSEKVAELIPAQISHTMNL